MARPHWQQNDAVWQFVAGTKSPVPSTNCRRYRRHIPATVLMSPLTRL